MGDEPQATVVVESCESLNSPPTTNPVPIRTRRAHHGLLRSRLALLIVAAACTSDAGPLDPSPVVSEFTFETGPEAWVVGFADYPAGISRTDSLELYQFLTAHGPLPAEIQPAQSGIRLRSINRSDDVFMFVYRKVTGLRARTPYLVTLELQLASNVPTNAVGAGGAPGEGVTIKAGAVASLPTVTTDTEGWRRLALDKGNQSIGGADLVVLGNVGVRDDVRQYELITRTSPTAQRVTTDADGTLWLVAGTDSGFEGLTDLYVARIRATMTPDR